MKTCQPFVVAPKDYARPLDVVGEHITVLASGEATGGYEIFLQRGPEGSGPPPHSHPWDESFYVTKGEMEFGVGSETMTAPTGTLVHLPAGTMHWFRFGKGGGERVTKYGDSASVQAVTRVNAEQASKRPMRRPTRRESSATACTESVL